MSAKSVKNNHIDYNACYYVSPEEYKMFMVRGMPQIGDVLLTTEAPMGIVACLDRDDVGIAQRLLTLRGKKRNFDNEYLLYLEKAIRKELFILMQELRYIFRIIYMKEQMKILRYLLD